MPIPDWLSNYCVLRHAASRNEENAAKWAKIGCILARVLFANLQANFDAFLIT